MPTPTELLAEGRTPTEIQTETALQTWRASRELLAMKLYEVGCWPFGRWWKETEDTRDTWRREAERIMVDVGRG